MDPSGIAFKIACTLIGIPLNTVIAVVILSLRRLHSKPRNIFLLAAIASNLTAFVPALFEVFHFFIPNDLSCELYIATDGLPDVFILLTTSLSLIDRCRAIKHPSRHKQVTVRRVLITVALGFIFSTLTCKFDYILQLISFDCETYFEAVGFGPLVSISMFTLCLMARVAACQLNKRLLPVTSEVMEMGEMATVSFSSAPIRTSSSNSKSNQPASVTSSRRSFRTQVNQDTPLRMEIAAMKTVVAGASSFLVLSGPFFMYSFSLVTCRFVSYNDPEVCSRFVWIAPYLRQLGLIHTVCHPSLYLFCNDEISAVFRSRCRLQRSVAIDG